MVEADHPAAVAIVTVVQVVGLVADVVGAVMSVIVADVHVVVAVGDCSRRVGEGHSSTTAERMFRINTVLLEIEACIASMHALTRLCCCRKAAYSGRSMTCEWALIMSMMQERASSKRK